MKKTTLLSIVIIILILLNIATLGFIFMKENHPHLPEGRINEPKDIIIKKLHFDEEQQRNYEIEITKHQKEISEIDKKIRENKHKLYSLLATPYNEEKRDSLIQIVAANQKKVELMHFNHFVTIKAICHQDQLAAYNELTRELPKLFAPPKELRRHE
ncbi:hypothetical protein DVK85_09010 [Flavobacterium arcticum]|uniref:Periplasmic heavy metal sensor n=1 Tax=Flavobacterium arcticum TaxID=1784713 RepID=A0A345HCQ2_9FLAO|nr:periplasmic heavy metal sensor [Flavobacterium arcticum]AXG74362.1 hypothetical protein DVK85_09010 [Flavobacterium arcticum]KAF2507523.1 periplasmic heavy metal sensor [Flavobacterium arcticum]